MISRVKKTVTKNGRSAGMPMAMITLEDLEGQIDGVLFAETYADAIAKFPGSVAPEQIVFVKGKIDKRRETPSLMVSEVIPVEHSIPKLTTGLVVRLDRLRHDPQSVPQIKPILGQYTGKLPVYLQIALPDHRKVTMRLNGGAGITASADLVGDLDHLLGSGSAELIGPGSKRARRIQQQQLFAGADSAPAQEEEALIEPTDDL
jgi:DNA polymerase-3 subunit alpha